MVRQVGAPVEARLIVTTVPPPRTPQGSKRIKSSVEWLLGPASILPRGIDWPGAIRGSEYFTERFRDVKPPRFRSVFEVVVGSEGKAVSE